MQEAIKKVRMAKKPSVLHVVAQSPIGKILLAKAAHMVATSAVDNKRREEFAELRKCAAKLEEALPQGRAVSSLRSLSAID